MNTEYLSSSAKIPPPAPPSSPTNLATGQTASTTSLVYRLLVNRVDRYLTAPRGKWHFSRWPLTMPALDAAINGLEPLSLCAASGIGTSRWTAIDVDDDASLLYLTALAEHLAPQRCVLFEHSRRGGHLFIFHQPVPWSDAHAFGCELAERFGLDEAEVFPKRQGIHTLRLPGSVHPKTGRRYPIIDPATGEVVSLHQALAAIRPIELPTGNCSEIPNGSPGNDPEKPGSSAAFEALVAALEPLTDVRVYAPGRGSARCPWHDDRHPSLFIKNARFHCLSSRCGVWGDVKDVARWTEQGIQPPR